MVTVANAPSVSPAVVSFRSFAAIRIKLLVVMGQQGTFTVNAKWWTVPLH